MSSPFKLVVLISGNGSNLQAIINAIVEKKIRVSICAVISNKANAYGLERAAQAGIPSHIISADNFPNSYGYELALHKQVDYYQPDLIVLAGFMRVLSKTTIYHWGPGRIINIHPSLLPKYRGLHTHKRAIQAKEKDHGASIHFVTEELDGGPVIAQMSLHILPEETPESLAARVQKLEHLLYPAIISWFVHDRVKLVNKYVELDGKKLTQNNYNKFI